MNDDSRLYRELSEAELQRCALHYMGKPLQDWWFLSGGLFNTTYCLETAEERVVMRLGPVNRHLLLPYEQGLMQAETVVQQLLHSHGIPTSRTRLLDTSRSLLDRDVAIVEYIPGSNFGEGSHTHRLEQKICIQAGALVRRIHEIRPSELPEPPENPFGRVSLVLAGKGSATWKGAILEELEQWRGKAEQTGLFTGPELDRIVACFCRLSRVFDSITEPRLVHGDLWYCNLMVDKEELTAIIDSDRAFFGDPEMDRVLELISVKPFEQGYGASLDRSADAVLRRKLYSMLLSLEDCYILEHEYCNHTDSRELKKWILSRLESLEQIDL